MVIDLNFFLKEKCLFNSSWNSLEDNNYTFTLKCVVVHDNLVGDTFAFYVFYLVDYFVFVFYQSNAFYQFLFVY